MTDDDLDEMAAVLGAPDPVRPERRQRTRADAQQWVAWNKRNYAEHGHGRRRGGQHGTPAESDGVIGFPA